MRYFYSLFGSKPADDSPFRPTTPDQNSYPFTEYNEYKPPESSLSIARFFPSLFAAPTQQPEYIRISLNSTTPEQEALLKRADALYQKHLSRTQDEKLSQKAKESSENKLSILNQCIYLLTNSTWGSKEALLQEKEKQQTISNNYTTNDGWSGYFRARNDTVILVEEVISWAQKAMLTDPRGFDIDSPTL